MARKWKIFVLAGFLLALSPSFVRMAIAAEPEEVVTWVTDNGPFAILGVLVSLGLAIIKQYTDTKISQQKAKDEADKAETNNRIATLEAISDKYQAIADEAQEQARDARQDAKDARDNYEKLIADKNGALDRLRAKNERLTDQKHEDKQRYINLQLHCERIEQEKRSLSGSIGELQGQIEIRDRKIEELHERLRDYVS